MNNVKSFVPYLKHRLYMTAIQPHFYIAAVIFNLFCAGQFFFGQRFLAGGGTSDLHYFFAAVPYICILIIPVLCIKESGISYEEYLPVSDSVKITVRWLSVFIQFFIMLVPLLLVPACVNLFGDVDAGQTAAGFIMILFYGAAAAAMCVFFSLIFTSNTVAFIISALCLAAVNGIHLISVYTASSSLLMHFVKAVSFSWHFDAAGKGIIDSRDIIYYFSVTAALLVFSVFTAERHRGKRLSKIDRRNFASIIIIFIFMLLNSSKYYFRADLTKAQKFTVSSYSRQILDSAEERINITYYRSGILSSLYPQTRDIADYLDEYASYSSAVTVQISDPDKNGSSKLLENYGITGRQIQTAGNNKTEFVNVYSAVIIEYMGRWEAIPFILSADTLEYDLAGRLLHLITGKQRSVKLLCGNGLSISTDYSYVIPWLNSQGFICSEITPGISGDLTAPDFTEDTDEGGKLLAVFGSSEISADYASEIENYIINGGRVLFAVSPYTADIENTWYITKPENQSLIKMLSSYGFEISENLAADISCALITMESNSYENGSPAESVHTQQLNYPLWVSLFPQEEAPHGLTLFWPSVINISNDNIKPTLVTSPASYQIEPDRGSTQSLFVTNPFLVNENPAGPSESIKSSNIVGAELNGPLTGYYQAGETTEDAHIAVISDQYFTSSLMLGYIGGQYGDYRNLAFLTDILLKLNGENELAELHGKAYALNTSILYKTPDSESFICMRNITLICIFVLIPLFFAAAAITVYIMRRKYTAQIIRSVGHETE